MSRSHPTPRDSQPSPGFVLVGSVVAPHGVDGMVRITALSDYPQRFAEGEAVYVGGMLYQVEVASRRGDTVVAALEGVQSWEEADRLRGAPVEVLEGDVPPAPEGTYYYFEVLGLEAYTVQGECLGVVTDILTTGANDVYVVRDEEGEVLVPALDDVVLEVDVLGGRMTVALPPGLR